ncbi:PREDICTED: transcription factor bHLH115 [Tarenaya hassleriana]|uniref:transcription factor bHLH115 n=1 Tax=Tarenaya hassleriana TaxID=28532 RepID=UPI00053C9680|nr:PREDICTED: transcription factor bHLH115 [Tarenaya hassleriana]
MVFPENPNWFCDYNLVDGDFSVHNSVVPWPIELISGSDSLSAEIDGFLGDLDGLNEPASRKRLKSESCTGSNSKACREKQRRDRLNDKFMELSSILEHGRPSKTDKPTILMDAVRMVNELRVEAQKFKELNSSLQEKIKELKEEKHELRDEKQKLKTEKEKLEQQLKMVKAHHHHQPQPIFLPNPQAVPQVQAPGNKLVQFPSYPGFAMWQFMPPASVDTSQDHVLRPPVA